VVRFSCFELLIAEESEMISVQDASVVARRTPRRDCLVSNPELLIG